MSLLNVAHAKGVILDAISEGLTIKDACKSAGVQVGNHYNWKANDPAYAEAYSYALSLRTERLEEVAEVRARDGYVEETIYYETSELGEEVQTARKTVRKYSDALLMMLLRAGNPQKFDPKNALVDKSEDDDLIKILASARKRLGKGKADGNDAQANS